MCRMANTSLWDSDGTGSWTAAAANRDLPRVLIAITAIKQRADFALEDIYNMNEIMRKTKYILSNIVIIHRNIRENSVIAIKRIDRLADHLDTYRRIVRHIHYEMDIKSHLDGFVAEIETIRQLNDTFGQQWLRTERRIEDCLAMFTENHHKIVDYKRRAAALMARRDFLKVGELCVECRCDYKFCKDLDQSCNEWCKESGDQCSEICDKVNQLESVFNTILKRSLDSMQTARQVSPVSGRPEVTTTESNSSADESD